MRLSLAFLGVITFTIGMFLSSFLVIVAGIIMTIPYCIKCEHKRAKNVEMRKRGIEL